MNNAQMDNDRYFYWTWRQNYERWYPINKTVGISKLGASIYSIELEADGIRTTKVEQGEAYGFTDRERILNAARSCGCDKTDSEIIKIIGDMVYPELLRMQAESSFSFAIFRLVLNGEIIPIAPMLQCPRDHGRNGGLAISYKDIHMLFDKQEWIDEYEK
jgi:hypothetical protein